VASQTLRNLVSVDEAATMPIFRPLIGADKIDILATAKKIGTYDISSEPFHDCCPVFLPRSPELSANMQQLVDAEANLDISELVMMGVRGTSIEKMRYASGRVLADEPQPVATRSPRKSIAIA
jgi:thiamine biosynthesis protein ThiI